VAATFFETRFCRFEAPAGWIPMPLVGVFERRSNEPCRSAVVIENWLEKPMKAQEYAAAQRAMLKEHAPGVEFLEETRYSGAGLSDAHAVRFRTTAKGGARLRQELIAAIEGPLAVSLTMTGLENDGPNWSRLFGGILSSFAITAAQWAREIARGEVAPKEPKSAGRVPAPGLQMSVPVAPGWKLEAEGGALRSPSGSEITIRRSGLSAGSTDELFAEALLRIHRDPGWKPRRWDRGSTPSGWPFFALESVALQTGTWVKKEPLVLREFFVQDEGPVAFRLQASENDAASVEALGAAVFGYSLLPAAERRLAVRESWLSLELAGEWQALGSGTYVRTAQPVTLLMTQRLPGSPGLKTYAESAARTLRSAPDVKSVAREDAREGLFKGIAGWRYGLDFSDADAASVFVRAAWFESGGTLYALTVRGPAGKETEDLFSRAIESVDTEAMKQGR